MKRANIIGVLLVFMASYKVSAQVLGIIGGGQFSKTSRKINNIGSLSDRFELGFAAGVSFNTSVNEKIPIETRLMLVHKPDQTYEKPLNFVNLALLLNPKLGKKVRLNFGPVIEYDTEKHGSASQLFFSGLVGLNFVLGEDFALNLDYQTNINNPGGSSNYKIRGQTIFLTAKYSFKKK